MTLGSHQRSIGASQVHLTPRRIITALGTFDLDPCASDPRPWDCAATNYTEAHDGLALPWFGRVWLNPPFHRHQVGNWISRMIAHGRGTLLVHARSDTRWFQPVFAEATALLFLAGRLIFHKPDGSLCTTSDGKVGNSGAPTVLVAFGMSDADHLCFSGLTGAFVPLRVPRSVLVGLAQPTWREALSDWLRSRHGPVALADLYRAFAEHPKARQNPHWREKIRQTLQIGGFERVGRGQWQARKA
jgi:hypothetical protein